MSDIPSDIFREILLRLPAKTLFRFRIVCKSWRSLIDDPSFIKSHSINQQSNCSTLLIREWTVHTLYSLPVDTLSRVDDHHTVNLVPLDQCVDHSCGVYMSSDYLLCNGMMLVYHTDTNRIWVIWNPLTQEFRRLNKLNADIRMPNDASSVYILWCVGFGYDAAGDDYKVVCIQGVHSEGKYVYKTLVYSLRLGSWRVSKDCPFHFTLLYKGVFFNGSLYWKTESGIVVFDLRTEDYSQLTCPVHNKPIFAFAHLNVLGGCLTYSFYDSNVDRCVGWMIKENEVEKSWMKLFSIVSKKRMWPVAYMKSKRQVIMQYDEGLLWFDLEKDTIIKRVTVDGSPFDITFSQYCPGSLFRLDDCGCDVARRAAAAKRKKTGTRLKLKFCVRSSVRKAGVGYCSA